MRVCVCVCVWKGEEGESAKGDKKIRTHPLSCRLTLFSELGELLGEGRWRKGLKRRTRRHHLAKVALVKGQMGARTLADDVDFFAANKWRVLVLKIENRVNLERPYLT